MRERARSGELAGSSGALALAVMLALMVALGVAASASAARTPVGYRLHRVCAAPRPGAASCTGIRLLPEAPVATGTGASPQVTYTEPFAGFLTPQALRSAYSLPSEPDSASLQTVAVVDAFDDPTAEADLGVFDKQFGLPSCTAANGCFRKVNEQGNPSPLPPKQGEWAGEISIDVQMAHSICQACRILLVETSSEEFSDLGKGVNAAIQDGATEVSNSYAGEEEPSFASFYDEYNADFYNHPGIVVTAASGDCGYLNEACLGVPGTANFPADSPDIVGVGGTTLTEGEGGWQSSVWDEGGSGCSELFAAPAWQAALSGFAATGCGTRRSIADVAAIGDPETGVDIYDSTKEGHGAPTGWGVWGGTSVASPIVAAEFALAGGAHGVSYPAATLYSHLGQAGALYDVTSGSNGTCGGASSCKARTGYDGPTGVGSPLGLGAFSAPGVPASTSAPTISGSAGLGAKLTALPGGWSGAPSSLKLQWERCDPQGLACAAISGSTGTTYMVGAADVGSTIRVQETAGNGAGEGAPAASAPTQEVSSSVPSIKGFSPSSGITGSTVTIEGASLGAVDEVHFGTLPASFTIGSPTHIEAVVPNGAGAATISVTAPGGSATSSSKFTPTLSITALKPLKGAPGKTVTLKGVGFNSGSVVSFDGHPAVTAFVSAKKLKATVPATATPGPVSVTNTTAPAGTVYSAASFTP